MAEFEKQINENVIIIIKKTGYTDAQKKAITTYRNKNREKINELHRKYYNERKDDPQFLETKRLQAKKYYDKKKANNNI